jgi:hypothetical protein
MVIAPTELVDQVLAMDSVGLTTAAYMVPDGG